MFSASRYLDVVNQFIADWSERNRSEMLRGHPKGCFFWDASQADLGRKGIFYTSESLEQEFAPSPFIDMTRRLIEQVDREREFVVVLQYPDEGKFIRLLLHTIS